MINMQKLIVFSSLAVIKNGNDQRNIHSNDKNCKLYLEINIIKKDTKQRYRSFMKKTWHYKQFLSLPPDFYLQNLYLRQGPRT